MEGFNGNGIRIYDARWYLVDKEPLMLKRSK
jgi:hypothetical protein